MVSLLCWEQGQKNAISRIIVRLHSYQWLKGQVFNGKLNLMALATMKKKMIMGVLSCWKLQWLQG